MLRARTVLVVGGLLSAAIGSTRQIDNGLPGVQPMDMGGMILSQNMLRMNLENATGPGKRRVTTPRRATGSAKPTYAASPAVRKRVLSRFLTYVDRSFSPPVAADIRKSFAGQGFVQVWARATAADGLRPGNVADSVTGYWAINYAIAHGKATPTAGEVRTLRRAISATVGANPNLRRMNDARKQEISEGLMLVSLLQAKGYATVRAANAPSTLATYRKNTVTAFEKVYGVDLTTLRLAAR